MKRSPLRRISAKRLQELRLRSACVRAVKARDVSCRFAWHLHNAPHHPETIYRTAPRCDGALHVHEPKKRSHGADPTNPDDCVLLCRAHHEWVHANPAQAEFLGLLERAGRVLAEVGE